MSPQKAAYIDRIRSESAYKWFRGFISIITLILYSFAGISIFVGITTIVVAGNGTGMWGIISAFIPLLIGVILFLIAIVSREASLMLADLADSVMDLNARYDTPSE